MRDTRRELCHYSRHWALIIFLFRHFPKEGWFLSGPIFDRLDNFLKARVQYFELLIHVFLELLLTFCQFVYLFLSVWNNSFGTDIAFHLLNDKQAFVWNGSLLEDKPNLFLKLQNLCRFFYVVTGNHGVPYFGEGLANDSDQWIKDHNDVDDCWQKENHPHNVVVIIKINIIEFAYRSKVWHLSGPVVLLDVFLPEIFVLIYRRLIFFVHINYLLDTKNSIREAKEDEAVNYHEITTVTNGFNDQSHHPAESTLCSKIKYKLHPNKQWNDSLDVPEFLCFPFLVKTVVNDEHIIDCSRHTFCFCEPQ